MRRAIQNVFGLKDGEFIVPEYATSMGAIGAIYTVLSDPSLRKQFQGFNTLNQYLEKESMEETHDPLEISEGNLSVSYAMRNLATRTKAYLGVDVGSISTNLVLIDEERNVLAKRYLMTEGRPLEAVKRGLGEIGGEVGD